MVKDGKVNNMIVMVHYYLKENIIQTAKDGKVKNMMIMGNYYLKENII